MALSAAETVRYQFGTATTVQMSASGDQDFTISNDFTVIDGETTPATGNRTLNLTAGNGLNVGAQVFVIHASAGSFATIAGTNVRSVGNVGGAAGTYGAVFIYTGSSFDITNSSTLARIV